MFWEMFGLMTVKAHKAILADTLRFAREDYATERARVYAQTDAAVAAAQKEADGWRFLAYSLTGANAGEGETGVASVEDGDAEHTPKAKRAKAKAAKDGES